MLKSNFVFTILLLGLMACKEGNYTIYEDQVMTTDEFVKEAKSLSPEEFDEKYPRDSEIELKGEVNYAKSFEDRVSVHFGKSALELHLTADFLIDSHIGTLWDLERQMKGTVHFKGRIRSAFYVEGEFMRCSFTNCIVK